MFQHNSNCLCLTFDTNRVELCGILSSTFFNVNINIFKVSICMIFYCICYCMNLSIIHRKLMLNVYLLLVNNAVFFYVAKRVVTSMKKPKIAYRNKPEKIFHFSTYMLVSLKCCQTKSFIFLYITQF